MPTTRMASPNSCAWVGIARRLSKASIVVTSDRFWSCDTNWFHKSRHSKIAFAASSRASDASSRKCCKRQFVPTVRDAIADDPLLASLIEPTFAPWKHRWQQLAVYDQAVRKHARTDPIVRLLMTAPGVGPVVALAYVTGIEHPGRFSSSSSVGAYFGMTPGRYQSGEVDLAQKISRCGDGFVRGMLYEAAKVLLSRTTRPSSLKVWGKKLEKRTGKKKAAMAVARKLSVILHRMWITGQPFRWHAETGRRLIAIDFATLANCRPCWDGPRRPRSSSCDTSVIPFGTLRR